MDSKYVVAIEIGSSLVKGAIGVVDDIGTLKVCAVECRDIVDCVRYGCIQNVEEVRAAVADIVIALETRTNISPRKIKSVYVALGGRSLQSYKRELEHNFEQETEITSEVINQLLDQAHLESFIEKDIADVLPIGFEVDNMKHTKPKGTYGHNLKVTLNIIACRPQIIKNIRRVLEDKMQLQINDFITRQRAIADLVLSLNETQLGCVLVDFGAETTTVSVHKAGVLQSLVTIPLGSRNITRDLTSLSITEEQAEKIKRNNVNANSNVAPSEWGKMVVEGIDDVEINKYVQARASEIVANIIAQIKACGLKNAELSEGIVVVGGGAKLKGFNSLLETNSSLKVRSGMLPAKIQIADNSIQPGDAIDVIAVLYAAIQSNKEAIVNCMTVVEPEQISGEDVVIEIGTNDSNTNVENIDDDDDGYDDDGYDDDGYDDDGYSNEGDPQPKPKDRRKNWFIALKKRLEETLGEALDEDPNENNVAN